ncbi:MAG: hypothetical protein RBR45_12655 [Pseudomonas sp.]|nr:hypothetical protein [Pseudomonas sp.]
MRVTKLHLQLLATLLQRGVAIDNASSVLTVLALLVGFAPWLAISVNLCGTLMAMLLILLGLAEKYWAQRVAIDAELFSLLAQRTDDLDVALSELDHALLGLGLIPAVAARSLSERSHAALRLLRWQASLFGVQCLFALLLCIAGFLL